MHRRFLAGAAAVGLALVALGPAHAQRAPDAAAAVGAAEEALRAVERLPPNDVRRAGPMYRLAWAYWRAGRREQAVTLLRQVVDLRGRAQGAQHADLVLPLSDVGFMLRELGRPAESAAALLRALQIAERTPALAQSALLGNVLGNLANLRASEGKADEARRLHERAAQVRVAAAQAAGTRDDREAQATILWRLALNYEAIGRAPEAVTAIQRAVQLREAARATDDTEFASMLVDQGQILRSAERYDEAVRVLQRALPLNERLRGPNDRIVGGLLYQLAAALRQMGRFDDADAAIRRAIAIRERNLGEDSLAVAQALTLGGRILVETQRTADAERMLERAQAILEQRRGADTIAVADLLRVRGFVRQREGKPADAEPFYRRAIAIREAAQGPQHAELALPLAELGGTLNQLGRLEEAGTVLERALAIADAAPSFGTQSAIAAAICVSLAAVRGAQGRPDDAQALRDRAIAARVAVVRGLEARQAQPLAISDALMRLGFAYDEIGQAREAARTMARAVEVRQAALGPDNVELAPLLGSLGYLLRDVGTGDEAERALRRAIAIDERARGPQHPELALHLFYLGIVYHRIGRYADAEVAFRRALAIREAVLGLDDVNVGRILMLLGRIMVERGRTAEADRLEQRAIVIFEARYGREHVLVAEGLRTLALLYTRTGHAPDAEPLLRRSLAIRERAFGPDHPFVAAQLNDLGFNLSYQGRNAEAVPFLERALAINRRAQGDSTEVANNYDTLARALRFVGRVAEAEAASRESLAIRERRLGPESDRVAGALNTLGRIVLQQGRAADAEPLLRRAVAIHERSNGPDAPIVGWDLHSLALALEAQDRLPEAVELVRRAASIMARRGTRGGDDSEPDSDGDQTAERRSFRTVFVDHVAMLARAAELPGADRSALTAEAFMSAQLAQAGGTAAALARMADRFAASDDALGRLLRQRGDLAERLTALDRALIATLAGTTSDDAADATRLRGQTVEARRAIAALDQQIGRDFPSYQRLIAGDGVPLAEVQRLLAPDEALLSYLVGGNRTHIFVIRRDRAALVRSDSGGPVLAREVRALRQSLDPSAVTSIETLPRYDLVRAYGLYRRVFEPAVPFLDGATQIFVAPDAALQSLPFAVMTSAPPAPVPAQAGPRGSFAAYRDAPWLARRYAFTTLPAAAALRALRDFARPSRAAEPFIGFGDPALDGAPGATRSVSVAAVFTRGGQIDLRSIRALPPLPETADELRALAASLHAPPESVRLRGAMTVALVRATDLSRYRVIAFATHGLTAGELSGVGEPGLIMTPPETPSDEDAGILTATMIARLNLDADWVILSACNTAAADGTPGAEALSGLARAFFYAGSRALLVSHWAVASEAAERLTTGIFAEAAAAPEIGRAEALRRSTLRLLGDRQQAYFAHPLFWAPFVVVGEGGRLEPGG
jgi:CHAT domain-containing protein